MSRLEDLQARADALLTRTDDPATVEAKIASTEGPSRRFSPFIPSELDRALELAGELMRIAAAEGGEAGVAAALAEAERRAGVEDVQLVRHAIELFIVHDPEAAKLAIPPIPPPAAKRAAAPARGRDRARGGARLVPRGPAGQRPPPPLAHRLPRARPPRAGRRASSRTARASCSSTCTSRCSRATTPSGGRSASARSSPFADYREPIGEGYEDRPSGQALRDVDRAGHRPAEPRRPRVPARPPARRGRPRARRRTAPGRGPLTSELLGALEEPTAGTLWRDVWHHGFGHVITAFVMAPRRRRRPGRHRRHRDGDPRPLLLALAPPHRRRQLRAAGAARAVRVRRRARRRADRGRARLRGRPRHAASTSC